MSVLNLYQNGPGELTILVEFLYEYKPFLFSLLPQLLSTDYM